jgi:hypothetical protein
MSDNIGMLWFDCAKIDFGAKLRRAIEYYRGKYGGTPNRAYVHPGTQLTGELPDGVTVVETKSMLPNHIWLISVEVKE